jgi:hypothetical protein
MQNKKQKKQNRTKHHTILSVSTRYAICAPSSIEHIVTGFWGEKLYLLENSNTGSQTPYAET